MCGKCLITGKPIDELSEYQIYAYCEGGEIVQNVFPYMVSSDAIEQIQELLSPQTRGELDDFIDANFGFPPEWRAAIKGSKVLLV